MTESRSDLVLRNARLVGGPGTPTDVTIRDGLIASVGRVQRVTAESVDLEGRYLMPGLWDHHVHFTQWARTRARLDVSAAESAAHAAQVVAARVATEPDQTASLAGFGFRDALWPDPPTSEVLDAVAPHRPVLLIGGDLHSVWVNEAAQARYGLVHSGLLREEEAFAVARMLAEQSHDSHHVLTVAAAQEAAARGVVGIVDFEMDDNAQVWAARMADGVVQLRVRAGFYKGSLEEMIDSGVRTGEKVDGTRGLLRVGPLKIITDGSLNTKTAYCHEPYPGTADYGVNNVPPAELEEFMARAQAHGFEAAIHAIGDLANTLALDAFEATGARGSIEHAQLVRPEDVARFAQLGVVASIQPQHALDDREVAEALWAGRMEYAYPMRTLHKAGATLALGSDAPVAPLDPWVTLAAAVDRSRDGGGDAWHPEQELPREAALVASMRVGTRALGLSAGEPADLVVCDDNPLTASAADLRVMGVAATLVAGEFTHRAL